MRLVNGVGNVYGWLIICVRSSYVYVATGLSRTVRFVKRVSSSLNYVKLLKQLFRA